jgi:hypothetical protein
VCCVDVDSNGISTGSSVNRRGDTTESFAEHYVRSAVQNPDDLPIAGNGHACDGPFGRDFDQLDSELLCQFAAARRKAFLQLRMKVVENSHVAIPSSVSVDRLNP